ncbi:MAG: caspase family protein, partial [Pyrinomonadaceae bacterium]
MVKVATPPNKRALLIGVNRYPNLPAHSQLQGCVNDVRIMKQTLETSFGFPESNVVVLVDEEATVKGIRNAMEELVADCRQDDIVAFHFSGHGSQMIAAGDKPSGYDESIMPYDSGRMNPTFPKQVPPCDIRDTEVQEWLSRLTQKTSHVTLIFDSCHSGSITRMQSDSEAEGTRLRWIAPDALPGGQPVPKPAVSAITRDAQGGSGWLSLSENYVLLAACAAEQGAYEMAHEEIGGRNG